MSDITMGDAVKWLSNLRDDCGKYQDMWHYAEALDQIIELLSVGAAPRWIPCEERLPEESGLYLVTTTDGDVYEAYIDEILHLFSRFESDGFYLLDNVDAWMPLPKPYREEVRE